MTSNTYQPSIDQGALLTFKEAFYKLAQQTTSKLGSTSAVTYRDPKGKTFMTGRMGRIELTEVAGRNPDKNYIDYAIDNRQYTKRRFTSTLTIDAKHDINELLNDPTSDLVAQLVAAKERQIDRVISAAATGAVLVGKPDGTPSSISAATDGVITVDATAGLTYEKMLEVTQNYINNEVEEMGAIVAVTGKEWTDLMGEDQFINNDYVNKGAVENGIRKAGMYDLIRFAGSVTGGAQVANPYLPEATTTRKCIVLAPQSIEVAMEIGDLSVTDNPNKVNSKDITIDLWLNAMRLEGAKVQVISTTM
jgi:hypothetical protein